MIYQLSLAIAALSASLVAVPAMAQSACKFPQIKVESKGEERIFTRCRSADDCETFAAFSKKDVGSYMRLIDQKDNLIDTAFTIATLPIGGVALTSTKIGRVLIQYTNQSVPTALRGLISLGKTKTPPPAGLMKDIITETYGARAGNLWAASGYIPHFFGGALSFTAPNIIEQAGKATTLALSPFREGKDPLVTGAEQNQAGTQGETCADTQIEKILDIKKRVESFEEMERRQAVCDGMSGPQAAGCREDLERYRRAERLAPSQERIRNILNGGTRAPATPAPAAVPAPVVPTPVAPSPSELIGEIVR